MFRLQVYRPVDGHRLVQRRLLLRHGLTVLLADVLLRLAVPAGPSRALLVYHLSHFVLFL